MRFTARATPDWRERWRVDLSTHRKEPWKEITCSDPTGILQIYTIELTPDGRSYAYTYIRTLSDLYLGDGLR